MNFKTYNEVLDYLYTLRTFGTKLGLDNIRFLLDELGKPDESCNFLHIAGSNGKGSTAAFLSSILQKAGLEVGMFSSPHLVRFTERIQINGSEIPEKEVIKLLNLALEISKKMEGDGLHRHPTFFEIVTAIAAKYFADRKCDVVVWETGMGGRLDATNAVTPVASIITNISFDHTQWLGDEILQIAAEKAGIIKCKVPVFTSESNPEVLKLFNDVARKNKTDLTEISNLGFETSEGESGRFSLTCNKLGLFNVKLGLLGKFQVRNASLAVVVANWYLSNLSGFTENIPKVLSSGLESVSWPARLQMLSNKPMTYLDCAHNLEGFKNLLQTLRKISPNKWNFVFGIVEDKNIGEILKQVLNIANEIWYIKPTAKRGLSSESFLDYVRTFNKEIPVETFSELKQVLDSIKKRQQEQFIICGSCYLAGDILSELEGKSRDLRTDDPINVPARELT